MEKHPLTSTFLHEFNLDIDLVNRALKDILQKSNSVTISNFNLSPDLDTTTNLLFHKTDDDKHLPIYNEELFNELQKCVDEVCNLYFTSQTKLAISESWMTRTAYGAKSVIHYHPFSIFSGVLYFNEQSPTIFEIEDPFTQKHKKIFSHIMKYQQPQQILSYPKKGKLIIFDSQISHGISLNVNQTKNSRWISPEPRYTLAFNTWFTGQVGHIRQARLTSNVVDVRQQNQ